MLCRVNGNTTEISGDGEEGSGSDTEEIDVNNNSNGQQETESSGDGEVTARDEGLNPKSANPYVDMSTVWPRNGLIPKSDGCLLKTAQIS